MTRLLLRLFVSGDPAPGSAKTRSAVGKLAGVTGFLCNVFLFLLKLFAGLLAHSVSLIADAFNQFSDAASSAITFLGFHLSQLPADPEHPYGHARYEYLSALAVSGLIFVLGFELAKSSIEQFIHPTPVLFSPLSLVSLLISIAVKLWMSSFFRTLSKTIHSTALHATSLDSRNDAIASAAVLAGYVAGVLFNLNIDSLLGLAVSCFILCSAYSLAKTTVSPLLGKQADAELVQRLGALILSHEKILGFHDLLIHDYGPGQCYASVHAELSAEESPLVCHDILNHIESDALKDFSVHLVIHYDPVTEKDEEWNRLKQILQDILFSLNPQLSMHDFHLVKDNENIRLLFDLAVPYSLSRHRQKYKKHIEHELRRINPCYLPEIHFDETL